MFNILAIGPLGTPELVVIFVVILLHFGAKKLPELARGVGKSLGEFRKAREDFEIDLVGTKPGDAKKDGPTKS
jgi:sec-independent protein translocase protein TatA